MNDSKILNIVENYLITLFWYANVIWSIKFIISVLLGLKVNKQIIMQDVKFVVLNNYLADKSIGLIGKCHFLVFKKYTQLRQLKNCLYQTYAYSLNWIENQVWLILLLDVSVEFKHGKVSTIILNGFFNRRKVRNLHVKQRHMSYKGFSLFPFNINMI